MFKRSGTQGAVLTIALAIAISAWANPASAQGFGVRAGGTANPDQLHLGGQYDFARVWQQVWLRPVGTFGIGDDATLIAMDVDALYRLPFGLAPFGSVYAGGGPGFHVFRLNGYSVSGMGFNAVSGVLHQNGMFAEARMGFRESPEFGIAFGYTWKPSPKSNRPVRPRR
jgi:hypothetical protein